METTVHAAVSASASSAAARSIAPREGRIAPAAPTPGWEGPSPLKLVAVALLACALALLAYVLVDWSGAFEIERIDVSGAPPEITRSVEAALSELEGESLASLGAARVQALAGEVPHVLATSIDRDFPGVLNVKVVLHRPVAVVRSGEGAWIVSSRGQVLETVKPTEVPGLPRIWLPAGIGAEPGETLRSATALAAARAIGRLPEPFPLRVVSAHGSIDDLTLIVGRTNGVEVRLGEAEFLRLKLEVAAQVMRSLSGSQTRSLAYLDVSVPERPVASWSMSE